MPDADILKLVNAIQDTKLAVAWQEIIFHRIDEPAHVRSAPEWKINYRPGTSVF
jgi:hypothetical protein